MVYSPQHRLDASVDVVKTLSRRHRAVAMIVSKNDGYAVLPRGTPSTFRFEVIFNLHVTTSAVQRSTARSRLPGASTWRQHKHSLNHTHQLASLTSLATPTTTPQQHAHLRSLSWLTPPSRTRPTPFRRTRSSSRHRYRTSTLWRASRQTETMTTPHSRSCNGSWSECTHLCVLATGG
jgi:hypothetical protein